MSKRDAAVALRLDNDMPVREIAERLGVARSTVGGWVKGLGETRHYRDCELCGRRFASLRSHARFCSHGHHRKHWRLYGASA